MARYACQQLGGFLAEPRSDYISNVITFFDFQEPFFIGLREKDGDGDFRWQTDWSTLSYTDWDVGQPDRPEHWPKDCVTINKNDRWDDKNCYVKREYLCQAKLQWYTLL